VGNLAVDMHSSTLESSGEEVYEQTYQTLWYGCLLAASACLIPAPIRTAAAQSGRFVQPTPQTSGETIDLAMYGRIHTEGQAHGHAMDYASALADGIGPRLTGSPNMKKANEWARKTLTTIGLENSHLEDWGEFGMGWYQINTWGRIVTPDPEPIWMQAAVWSAATSGPVTGEIVYLPLNDASELNAVQSKLKGKIVLLGSARPASQLDQPLSFRYTEDELKELEGPGEPRRSTRASPANAASRTERRRVGLLRQRGEDGSGRRGRRHSAAVSRRR
jgi:carboxypeptidase Q